MLDWDSKLKKAGSTVSGLRVTDDIPNTDSISASFDDYEVLKGVREVSMKYFGGPRTVFYAKRDFDQARSLKEKIQVNGWIDPLIVAVDEEGPYILEGAHRYVALYYLDVKTLPALIVLDLDEVSETLKFLAGSSSLIDG